MSYRLRDSVTIRNELGKEMEYFIEALFDVDHESYALIRNEQDLQLMKIEEIDGEQYFIRVEKPDLHENILEAYQIAVQINPANTGKDTNQ